jgi:hypothetical protein
MKLIFSEFVFLYFKNLNENVSEMIEALIYLIINSFQPEEKNEVFEIIDKVVGTTLSYPSDEVSSLTDWSLKCFLSTELNSTDPLQNTSDVIIFLFFNKKL